MKVLVQLSGQRSVFNITPQEVYEIFVSNGQTPVENHKFKVGDGYGYSSRICRTDDEVQDRLSEFPEGTIFQVQYHPAGIEFNPQIKTIDEIKTFQESVSKF